MSEAYKLIFVSPLAGVSASWEGQSLALSESVYAPDKRLPDLGADAPFFASISVARTDLQPIGDDDGASIYLLAGNWPNPCTRGLVMELGGGFNGTVRKRLEEPKYNTKSALVQSTDCTMTVRYDPLGILTVCSGISNLSIPVYAMVGVGETQRFRLVVEPTAGVTATITILGVAHLVTAIG